MTPDPIYQPARQQKRDRGDDDEQRDESRDEEPVANRRATFFIGVAFEEREIQVVGLPCEVEDVANNRQQPDERVNRDVEDHSQLDDSWYAEIAALPKNDDRKERRGEVTEARHEAEQWIEAEAKRRARHDEGRVEQAGHMPQRLETPHLTIGQRAQFSDATTRAVTVFHFTILRFESPLQEQRAHGEPGADRNHQQEVTTLEAAVSDCVAERQWNRRSRGIAELLDVDHDLLIR